MAVQWEMSASEFLALTESRTRTLAPKPAGQQAKDWLTERARKVPSEAQIRNLHKEIEAIARRDAVPAEKAFEAISQRADALIMEADGDFARAARMVRAADDRDAAILIDAAIEVETNDTIRTTKTTGDAGNTGQTSDDDVDPFDILDGLPLMFDDKKFIEAQVQFLSHNKKVSVLEWYRRIWLKAQSRDRNIIRRENTGRRHANSFLRRYLNRTVRRT
jgi:hypothetical protein